MVGLPLWGTETVEVIHPVFVDDHGVARATYPDSARRELVAGVDLQPSATSENDQHADSVLTAYNLFLPLSVELSSDCLVQYLGKRYQINGDVRVFNDPLGVLSYKVAELTDWGANHD